jgi:uncharacterized protein (DUF4415 family)
MSEKRRSTPSERGKARKAFKVVRVGPQSRRRTDFARLDAMSDEDIAAQIAADPDVAPEFTEEMAREARWAVRAKKTPISFRVDGDVLEFFKGEGPGYQSRMNAVLRAYVEHHRRRGPQKGPRA